VSSAVLVFADTLLSGLIIGLSVIVYCACMQSQLNCVRGEHKPARCRSFETVTLRLTS